ncbi:MAG TPA: FAD/NAD(P)-binding protein [Xanthomonadaceae bacterium]|nr:FAD/NAD(P)-binding protein [Xanthomonadaceae bacterium]
MRTAVVGAGFAGVATALQLCGRGIDTVLVGSPALFGRGVAYGAAHPEHLLNVPADRMGIAPDAPEDFADWLGLRGEARGAFLPRLDYGRYLDDRLRRTQADCGERLHVHRAEVLALARAPRGWRLDLDDGTTLEADTVVLAPGAPAGLAPPQAALPGVIADPWRPSALAGIAPDAPVLIVGTGLTMADLLVSLETAGHAGPIVALSRRGLLPRTREAHAAPAPLPRPLLAAIEGGRLAAAVLRFRAAVAGGASADAFVEALRGLTPALWRGWPLAVRRRFLRHLRPWWDTIRHRVPPQTRARLDAAQARGQLRVLAGRLLALEAAGGALRATLRPRHADATATLDVAHVIFATGLDADLRASASPLLARLLDDGLAVPDPTGLGLACDPQGALLDHRGAPVPGLHVVGALRRGECWESTAVAELRAQAAALAARLAGAVAA